MSEEKNSPSVAKKKCKVKHLGAKHSRPCQGDDSLGDHNTPSTVYTALSLCVFFFPVHSAANDKVSYVKYDLMLYHRAGTQTGRKFNMLK